MNDQTLTKEFLNDILMTQSRILQGSIPSVVLRYNEETMTLFVNTNSYKVPEPTIRSFLCSLYYGIHQFLAN